MQGQGARPQYTIGVDIAQEQCAWAVLEGAMQQVVASGEVDRSPEALTQWADMLHRRWPQALMVLEATGGLERMVRQALYAVKMAVVVASPKRVQRLRESAGWAKTDLQDAEALALWGWLFAQPQPQAEPEEERMRDLLRRQEQLMDMLHRERMRLRLRHTQDAYLRKHIQQHITHLEQQLQALEKEIQRQLDLWTQENPEAGEDLALLQSVPGVGLKTALTLRLFMPELGHLDAKQVAALSGTAPMARDSGKKRGKRRIRGGRRRIRRVLFMAALTWTRHKRGPLWEFYHRLRQRGKPTFVALVALMRRLLVILNAILRHRTPWDPQKALAKT